MYLATLGLSCGTGDLFCCCVQNLELRHAYSSLQRVLVPRAGIKPSPPS